MCEKLHAFRSPLLELATSGAGDLMKNMIKQIHFCGPDKLFLVSFINYSWLGQNVALYSCLLLTFPRETIGRLLPTMEVDGSRWPSFHFVNPMAFTCITCLGLEFGTSGELEVLPFCCICTEWWAGKPFSQTYNTYFNCPLNSSSPGLFSWGKGMDCMMSETY